MPPLEEEVRKTVPDWHKPTWAEVVRRRNTATREAGRPVQREEAAGSGTAAAAPEPRTNRWSDIVRTRFSGVSASGPTTVGCMDGEASDFDIEVDDI